MISKIWCVSDTHGKHGFLKTPDNIDLFIHAGDLGIVKSPHLNINGVLDTLEWIKSLPIKNKIVIAGNHDTSIEHKLIDMTKYYSDFHYLEHDSIVIEELKIFGSPYTPSFGVGWAFNKARHKLYDYWQDINEDTDIIVTHGPPAGILDHTECDAVGERHVISCGCKALLKRVKKINPKLMVFGHIHSEENCHNAGIMQISGLKIKFVNASVVDLNHEFNNNGQIIEI